MNNHEFEICTGNFCDEVRLIDLTSYNIPEITDFNLKHKIIHYFTFCTTCNSYVPINKNTLH